MSDRGMKKWAPFSSLIEQSTMLEEMFYEKHKQAKPSISIERADKINNILLNCFKEKLRIKYFYDGYIYELSTDVKRVDTVNKKLILEDGNIPFSEIIDINVE